MKKLMITIISIIFMLSCEGEFMISKKIETTAMDELKPDKLKKLAEKTIIFAHQSVGDNILSGIESIQKVMNIQFDIKSFENNKNSDFTNINHLHVGENQNPVSKMEDYYSWLFNNQDKKIDIAFLKFCYIDFNSNTDVEKLINQYKDMIEKIKKIHPETTLVHFTVPLTSYSKDIKSTVKLMLNRSVTGIDDNIQRQKFNNLIIKEYQNNSIIFDIAKFESTSQKGDLKLLKAKGQEFQTLLKEYTSDGGHLNDLGQKYIAAQLLHLLPNL